MSRDISPPPTKRRRIATSQDVPRNSLDKACSVLPELPDAASDTMRVFSWNINGIAPFLQKPITSFFQSAQGGRSSTHDQIPPASLRGFLQRHKWPAILFLQEVKIAASDAQTQDAVRNAVNERSPSESSAVSNGPKYEAHFTLPNDPHNARGMRGNGKVYGVCSIVRQDLLTNYGATVRTVEWDKEGRISVVGLTSAIAKLALFNIYAVNGTDNPYRNPATGAVRGTRHDRKLAFHRLLMEECIKLENDGWRVLLAGDMNVAPTHLDGHPRLRTFPPQHVLNRADFIDKLLSGKKEEEKGFNGVDVWRKMHEKEKRYTYFSRNREWGSSCDRVDYMIAGRNVWDDGWIRGSGILDTEAERGPSDHVPIWVDIKMRGYDELDGDTRRAGVGGDG